MPRCRRSAVPVRWSVPLRPADLHASKQLFQLIVQPQLAHLLTDAQFDDALTTAGGNGEHPHAGRARMVTQPAGEHTMSTEGAARLPAWWAATFREWDVLLCPVTPASALRHGDLAEVDTRTITVNGVERPCWDQVRRSQAISGTRLPAASLPVGLSRSGLLVGPQIVGPYLEDRTVVDQRPGWPA
jgi:amidase